MDLKPTLVTSNPTQKTQNSATPNTNTNEWAEIAQWLQELNYANYLQSFKDGGYDLWEIMFDLTVDDLKSLDILPGHAKRIHSKLKLKKDTESSAKAAPKPENESVNNKRPKSPEITPKIETPKPVTNETNLKIVNKPSPNVTMLTQSQREEQLRQQRIVDTRAAQQLHLMAVEERKRKIRERFKQNAMFAGGIKNKLFETMTRVLNGLQQELIQYNGKFAEPINEMNQRIVALQKLDVHNLDGIWDSNDGLFEPMMRNVRSIKKFNASMWDKINEFHKLAEMQIKQSMTQLETQINVINQMKAQYLVKQQQINGRNVYHKAPLNTIVTNGNTNMNGNGNISHVNISNINTNTFNYAQFIAQQQKLRQNQMNNAAMSLVNNVMGKGSIQTPNVAKAHKKHSKNGKSKKKKHSKPAYTSGELQMMENYDKKKQTVADIIDLQRNMQSIYGIPRSAYGIAQKMYRMGVLSATLPKKLQALQDKSDTDKIKIGDSKGRKLRSHQQTNGTDSPRSQSVSISESYYSSNDETESSDDDISSESSEDNARQRRQSNLFMEYTNHNDASVPQRKPPSTNLRRYTVDEVKYIRKLIDIYPTEEAKVLFSKFRERFPIWRDETESYTKFYQKKWRLCKEREQTDRNNHKRKRRSQSPQKSNSNNDLQSMNLNKSVSVSNVSAEPPFKKFKVSGTAPPLVMETLIPKKEKIEGDIMPPPLPPPPINSLNTNSNQM